VRRRHGGEVDSGRYLKRPASDALGTAYRSRPRTSLAPFCKPATGPRAAHQSTTCTSSSAVESIQCRSPVREPPPPPRPNPTLPTQPTGAYRRAAKMATIKHSIIVICCCDTCARPVLGGRPAMPAWPALLLCCRLFVLQCSHVQITALHPTQVESMEGSILCPRPTQSRNCFLSRRHAGLQRTRGGYQIRPRSIVLPRRPLGQGRAGAVAVGMGHQVNPSSTF